MRFLAIHDFIFYLIYIPFTYFLLFTYKNPPPILLAVDSYLKIDYIVNSLYFLFGSLKTAMIVHIHCNTCIGTGKRTIPMTETVHRAFVELRKQNLILGRRSDAEVDQPFYFIF